MSTISSTPGSCSSTWPSRVTCCGGRKLYRYFGQAGIAEPQVRLAQGLAVTEDLKEIAVLTLEATADAIISAGLASASEVAAALADLRAFAATLVGDPRTFQV